MAATNHASKRHPPCAQAFIERWILALFIAYALNLSAGTSPQNVALIVNGADLKSMRVANEYQQLRQIPPRNVIYLADIPAKHVVSLDFFKSKILSPILQTLQQRRLIQQIDVVVYSSGFPTTIDCKKAIDFTKYTQMHNAKASITGLTYLYQLTLSDANAFVQPHTNFYAQVASSKRAPDTPWTKKEKANYQEVMAYLIQRQSKTPPTVAQTATAKKTLMQLATAHPNHVEVQYNRACLQALTNNVPGALASLEAAVRAGWNEHGRTLRDPDLTALRKLPKFKELIEEMKAVRINVASKGFSSRYGWDASGSSVAAITSDGQRPPRYLLSSMLGAHLTHGIDLDHTLAYLKGARAADGTHPNGTIYFTEHKDVRSTTRAWARESAVAAVQAEGVDARIFKGQFPDGAKDVAGTMCGFATHKLQGHGTRLRFGAICDNLTSWGGVLHEDGQTKMVEFLKMGAAGTSGTVSEPYALQFKFADPFLQVHYVRGCTLAEAYYQSIRSPYNLLIMGDPLCAPWARPPVFTLASPIPEIASGKISIKPLAASPIAHYEIFIDGIRTAFAKPGIEYPLPTSKLADGWHQLDVIAVAAISTQVHGRLTRRFKTRNHELSISTEITSYKTFLGGTVNLAATSEGADKRAVVHNGRTLAVSNSDKGKLSFPAVHLGAGTSTVQIIAIHGTTTVQSEPIEIIIK